MGYEDIDTSTEASDYIRIGAGESVDIHILTKSEDIKIVYVHWTGSEYQDCVGDLCPLCKDGNEKLRRYIVKVIDRKDGREKTFKFGVGIAIGIKETAATLRLDGMSVHDVDLRVSRVSENPVRYQVIHRKKAGGQLKSSVDDQSVPF